MEKEIDAEKGENSRTKLRNAIAFSIFGICNSVLFYVIISAAEDIIKGQTAAEDNAKDGTNLQKNGTEPDLCIPDLGKPRCEKLMSTGAILLAAILPSLTLKSTLVAIIHRIPFCFLHFLICLFQVTSFLVLAFSTSLEMSLIGVMFTSAAAGMGEMCFLMLTSFHDKSTFTGWSAGTGFGAIIGSMAYSTLTEPKFLGLSTENALLVMLVVPAVLFTTYWTILVRSPRVHQPQLCRPSTWIVPISDNDKQSKVVAPIELEKVTDQKSEDQKSEDQNSIQAATQKLGFNQKIKLIKSLVWVMSPMFLLYLLDYTMCSGLLQHMKFDCDHSFGLSIYSQFRWFQTLHVIGGFIPRVTIAFMELPTFVLYLLTFLQIVNLVIFYTQALFSYIPHILAMFAIIFVEGIMQGSVYTFIGIVHRKATPETREFSLAVVSMADTIGIVLAGFLAIWAHNHICQLYPVIFE